MTREHEAGRPGDAARVLVEQASEIASLRAELAAYRAHCQALIQEHPRPMWVYSLESLHFLDVNAAAVAAYGFTRDEFLGMTIADIRPPEDVPALVANVARMRATSDGVTGPWRHRLKDGTLVEVTVTFRTFPFWGRSARLVLATRPLAAAAADALTGLSPRERQVFCLVARGHTSRQIAERLALSPKSVETYRARFTQKLALRTRADVLRYALEHDLLGDEPPASGDAPPIPSRWSRSCR
jgi:PAS domain S-box-containing protein